MAKAKAKRALDYHPYPAAEKTETGMKVGWRYYKDRNVAAAAALAAKHNAKIQASLGYDFGYQAPGSITTCGPNYRPQFSGLFEVCIP